MMTTTIDVREVPRQLTALLKLAKAGNEVIISEGNTPVARLTGMVSAAVAKPRVAGLHPGAISVSLDFDQPLPDEFWLGTQ